MNKRKTTTVSEKFDKNGNVTERVTTTVEEEVWPTDAPAPAVPYDPPPATTPSWPFPNDPWWTHPITSDPINRPIVTCDADHSTETYKHVYVNSENGDTIYEY